MKTKLISMLLALSMVLGTTPAMAQTRLTALGESNILEGIAQPMAAAAPAAVAAVAAAAARPLSAMLLTTQWATQLHSM